MSEQSDRLKWWKEARFGLFIHWGIYSVPAGIWQGKPVPSLGEWIMYNGKIPIAEYEKLAGQFNPVKFNAREWVDIARRAGMKYLVITAKHHDGFAMYDSPCSDYDIADATPYGHDVMADLADACREAGLKLCFYYSQSQDWHAPGGAGHWEEQEGRGWWDPAVVPERFARYLEEKAKPQVRELLTQYGPIGLIWFDTPVCITREQSLQLRDLVHELQPDCLVSGRVGNDVGDYGSLGDNQIPLGPLEGQWETPATMNDTWGFKSDDHNWKSTCDLLYLLVDLTSKGVNYLLNVGPTCEGLIPQPSVDRLLEIGKWMDVNSEAIYATEPNPWPYEFEWGRVTTRPGKLFLLFYDWSPEFSLCGLRNNVTGAHLLAAPEVAVDVTQEHDAAADSHVLRLGLPAEAPDPLVSVVVVEFEGELDVDPSLAQQPSGLVSLPAYLAEIQQSGASELSIGRSGVVAGWKDPGPSLTWRFKLSRPGRFKVRVILGSGGHRQAPAAGHTVRVAVAGETLSDKLAGEETINTPRAQYFPETASTLGTLRIGAAGAHELRLEAEEVNPEAPQGLSIAGIELVKED